MRDLMVPEQVIDEIKALCAKHDVACLAIVASPSQMAYVYRIDPTWSCAWMEPCAPEGKVAVRFRSKLADYGGDKEKQKAEVEATTGMFISFMNWAEYTLRNMTQITAMFGKHFPEIAHSEKWQRGQW